MGWTRVVWARQKVKPIRRSASATIRFTICAYSLLKWALIVNYACQDVLDIMHYNDYIMATNILRIPHREFIIVYSLYVMANFIYCIRVPAQLGIYGIHGVEIWLFIRYDTKHKLVEYQNILPVTFSINDTCHN